MRFINLSAKITAAALLLVIISSGCRSKTRILKSPPHYNFAAAFVDKLDPKLLEISGIAWDTKNNYFLAVDDNSDKLFFLDKENKIIIQEVKFGDAADYEDVAILNGVPYILRSDGLIIKFVKDSATGNVHGLDYGPVNISGTNDFETMYSDPARNALVLICKNCAMDDEKSISAFAFYPDSIGFDPKPLYTIDAAKIKDLAPVSSAKFQPSGAAINPVMQKLFILSSASHQLAITDLNGKVESVYRLSPKLFRQPEGITFKEKGDMYISNEGIKGVKPTLLKFSYTAMSDSEKVLLGKAGYNFTKPDDKMKLGKQLHEISGMAYIPKKNVILAENDEKGDIFMVDFANKVDNIGKVKFGGKGDYEDIVHTDTAEYMLVSTGSVIKVNSKDSTVATQQFDLVTDGTNEFEAMYLDADGKTIILLCKQCAHEKDKVRGAYRFDPATQSFSAEQVYSIDIASIRTILNDEEAEFKPSAAAINPVTGKLFIVASVGKLLVIADVKGKVEQVFKLDPVMYNQPEGMTFAPNGDLYISNEGGDGIATILKFNYKK